MAFELSGISARRPVELVRPQSPILMRAMRTLTLLGALAGVPQLIGCLSEGEKVADLLAPDADGIPVEQPPVPDGGVVTDSGAHIVDGSVYLPHDDAGNTVLPDDIWFTVEGQGSFFVETPMISYGDGTPLFQGSGVQNMRLVVQIGTDSTRITEPHMPASGCFPGLIKLTAANELVSCLEPGYEAFANCPSESANRIPVYFASYTLEGYRDGELIGTQPYTYSTLEALYQDPASGTPLGSFCDGSQIGIEIPQEWYNNGSLSVRIRFRLIAMAQGDANATYRNIFGLRVRQGE